MTSSTPTSSAPPGNIRLRCPHCGHHFPPQDKGRCPACGRILLIPPAARRNAAAMRDRWLRLSRERRDRLAAWRQGAAIAFSRRARLVFGFVALAFLGVILPLRYMLRQPAEAPPLTPEERAVNNLRVLRTALECFYRDCRRYPATAEGLRALVLQPPATPGWKGPYIELLKPDPWRHAYVYLLTNAAPTLFCAGPDGRGATADDLPAPPPDMAFVHDVTPSNAPPTEALHPAGYVELRPAP
jgi:general secretion pathway protein G